VLFYPLYAALVRRMPGHESAAAGIALLAVVVAILLPSILLGRAISGEVSALYAVVKDKNWSDWIPPQIPMAGDDVRAFVTERLDSISGVALRLARPRLLINRQRASSPKRPPPRDRFNLG